MYFLAVLQFRSGCWPPPQTFHTADKVRRSNIPAHHPRLKSPLWMAKKIKSDAPDVTLLRVGPGSRLRGGLLPVVVRCSQSFRRTPGVDRSFCREQPEGHPENSDARCGPVARRTLFSGGCADGRPPPEAATGLLPKNEAGLLFYGAGGVQFSRPRVHCFSSAIPETAYTISQFKGLWPDSCASWSRHRRVVLSQAGKSLY